MGCLLGLDVGTTGCKALFFREDGRVLGYARQEYPILYTSDGGSEQNAEQVLLSLKKCIIQASPNSTIQVDAIGLSVQGDAIIPVDEAGNPLCHALLGMDYRSALESKECERMFGAQKLFQRTGMRPHPMNSLPKILWLKKYRPKIYQSSWKIMTYADFIMYRLGADPTIDVTMATRTMAVRLDTLTWDEELLDSLGVDSRKLSNIAPSGAVIGTLSKNLAVELGLCGPCLLTAGVHDQVCAALGAGAYEEGSAVDSHGTAEVFSTLLPHTITNYEMFDAYYPCYAHAIPGKYFTFALNHTGGLLMQWLRDTIAESDLIEAKQLDVNIYDLILSRTPIQPSNLFFLPHFNGSGTPTCNPSSRGAILGLTTEVTKYDIVKGLIDSLAYELRYNLEQMQTIKIPINRIYTVGGAAKSSLWTQTKADIWNREIWVPEIMEAACMGAAILAGAGCGIFHSIEQGINSCVHIGKKYFPVPERVEQYTARYKIYQQIYPALYSINEQITKLPSHFI